MAWKVFFLPAFVGSRKALRGDHDVGGHEEEGGIGDGMVSPPGLLLGVLKCVDVLGHPLGVQMEALHIVLQRQDVEGV